MCVECTVMLKESSVDFPPLIKKQVPCVWFFFYYLQTGPCKYGATAGRMLTGQWTIGSKQCGCEYSKETTMFFSVANMLGRFEESKSM